MADFGTAGGKEPSSVKNPTEGGTPKTGFGSAPKGEVNTFNTAPGHGGSNRGAH